MPKAYIFLDDDWGPHFSLTEDSCDGTPTEVELTEEELQLVRDFKKLEGKVWSLASQKAKEKGIDW